MKDREIDIELQDEVSKLIERLDNEPYIEELHGAKKEIQAIIVDLEERKKKLRDCHIKSNFELRKKDFAKVKKMRDGQPAKVEECIRGVKEILSDETLQFKRPKRKIFMEETKNKTIPELTARSKALVEVLGRVEKELNDLRVDLDEYGEVLRDQSIQLLITFIQRNTKLRRAISNIRKDVVNVDEDLEIILVRVNDLNMPVILKEFNDDLSTLTDDLKKLEKRGEELLGMCKEYEDEASEDEELNIVLDAKSAIATFITTCSWKQTLRINKDIDSLKKNAEEYEFALNKEQMRNELISLVKALSLKMEENKMQVEEYWITLAKKSASFEDFDICHKVHKRQKVHNEGHTLQIQIRDQLSTLHFLILEKLDMKITDDDRATMKELQKKTEEY